MCAAQCAASEKNVNRTVGALSVRLSEVLCARSDSLTRHKRAERVVKKVPGLFTVSRRRLAAYLAECSKHRCFTNGCAIALSTACACLPVRLNFVASAFYDRQTRPQRRKRRRRRLSHGRATREVFKRHVSVRRDRTATTRLSFHFVRP